MLQDPGYEFSNMLTLFSTTYVTIEMYNFLLSRNKSLRFCLLNITFVFLEFSNFSSFFFQFAFFLMLS